MCALRESWHTRRNVIRANLLSHVSDPLWYNIMVASERSPSKDGKKFGERVT